MVSQVSQSALESPQTAANASGVETEEKMNKKAEPQFTCPECKAKGILKEFQNASGRASHRSRLHGVRGSSPSVAYLRKKKVRAVTHDKAERQTANATKNTSLVKAAKKEGVLVPQLPQVELITPAMLGYAMGRMQSLVEQIARENGLPEKEFVYRVAINFAELVNQ